MPKKKAKNRPGIEKKTESTVSRKNVLKIGAAGGAGILAPAVLTPRKTLGFQGTVTGQMISVTPSSSRQHPTVNKLEARFPMENNPLRLPSTEFFELAIGKDDGLLPHLWTQFTLAHSSYLLEVAPGPPWNFNGEYPDPICLDKCRESALVQLSNDPSSTARFAKNDTTADDECHNANSSAIRTLKKIHRSLRDRGENNLISNPIHRIAKFPGTLFKRADSGGLSHGQNSV